MNNQYPSPQTLQWLAMGQFANRFQRSIRVWLLLNKLYGNKINWAKSLPQTFTYPELRDKLFAPTHPTNQLTPQCQNNHCICHQTSADIVFAPENRQFEPQWLAETMQLTGMSEDELHNQLTQRPFATVHRTLRDDLKHLAQMGWLQIAAKGKYRCIPYSNLPKPPNHHASNSINLSITQAEELLRILESIAFVQPNLSVIMDTLWQQIADTTSSPLLAQTNQQRIFLHLDYILPPETQDKVDNYQEQLEQLWCKPPGGVVQFEYWVAKQERKIQATVYPVCLHYSRRAKYLSAYGIDPDGDFGWHNYRLDRIASEYLTVLPWGSATVPQQLKELWHAGDLPTSAYIQTQLDAAWGFNFYLKKELLILRFPPKFAKWYVDNTFRHPTFRAIKYQQLPKLIEQISELNQRQQLLKIIENRSAKDSYYTAWIRSGDINVLMRLRDWRPNGEVIAPLSIRQKLHEEAKQELANYQ